MGRHGFANRIDRARVQCPRQRLLPQGTGRRRRDFLMKRRNRMGAAGKEVDEGLDEDRGFRSDDVGAQDVTRLAVDDELDEAVVRGTGFKAQGIALDGCRVVIDCRFRRIARLLGLDFRQAYVGRFGVRIGHGWYRIVLATGPEPCRRRDYGQ